MTNNMGPMDRGSNPYAEITIDGTAVLHFMDAIDLPEGKKRQSCIQHIKDGLASEMLSNFDSLGCDLPKPDEEQIIRTAFICPGPSILKKCRLRLIQADAAGKVLNEGKII
jgi:hypothetical protein